MTELDDLINQLARETRAYIEERLSDIQAKHALALAELQAKLSAVPSTAAYAEVIDQSVAKTVAASLSGEVSKQFESLLPYIKGEPGKPAEVDYERIAGMVKGFVDAIPPAASGRDGAPGKDAEVDYDRIGNIIAVAVEKEQGKYPRPKDGRDGRDGKDAAPVDEDALVRRVLEQIPAPVIDEAGIAARAAALVARPENGRDGKDGKDGRDGRDVDEDRVVARVLAMVPIPKDGADGRDADETAIVRRVLEQIPQPKDGVNGNDGKDADEVAVVERVLARVPIPKDGRDGKDGASVHQDTIRVMVEDAVDAGLTKAVSAIPRPQDGKSVDPVDVKRLVGSEVAQQFEALLPYLRGEPGPSGFSPDDLELELSDDSVLTVRLKTDTRIIERSVALPILRNGGLYVKGRAYRKGAVVTYGGSSFVAERDTTAPIGEDPPSPDWRLFVQRGRNA
jgi:hypothetical protein